MLESICPVCLENINTVLMDIYMIKEHLDLQVKDYDKFITI